MSETKKEEKKPQGKKLEAGMYNCEKITGNFKGDKVVYHSSTAETLQAKGLIKVLGKIKVYKPKTIKE